jgi:hypothetical protein
MLKKAASGVLTFFPCSRTGSTLRTSNTKGSPSGMSQAIRGLRDLAGNSRPCWTDIFEHSGRLLSKHLVVWCLGSLESGFIHFIFF